jgi:hypothetical protein
LESRLHALRHFIEAYARERYVLSVSFTPWMSIVRTLAEVVARNRVALSQDHPLLKLEREGIERASQAVEQATNWRDASEERDTCAWHGPRSAIPGRW